MSASTSIEVKTTEDKVFCIVHREAHVTYINRRITFFKQIGKIICVGLGQRQSRDTTAY